MCVFDAVGGNFTSYFTFVSAAVLFVVASYVSKKATIFMLCGFKRVFCV